MSVDERFLLEDDDGSALPPVEVRSVLLVSQSRNVVRSDQLDLTVIVCLPDRTRKIC